MLREGSCWNGRYPLSRFACLFRLIQAHSNIAPITKTTPPTPATTIPIICAVDNTGLLFSGDELALVAAAGCGTPVDDFEFVVELGIAVAVAVGAVVSKGVAIESLVLVVATGAIWTILAEPDCKTRVAVRVLCVFGSAFLSELHMLYAFSTVSSARKIRNFYEASLDDDLLEESSPLQKPTLASDIIHCTAPSPTVYVDLLPFSHKQSNVGVSPQTSVG